MTKNMSEDLANYIERSQATIDTFPEMTESDVEMKFIQPLIDLLGWDRFSDVRTQYSVRAGTTQIKVDYALFIGEQPEVIIEAKAGGHDLIEDDREQLRSYMRQTETDWGLLTNGKKFQVLSLTSSANTVKGALFETTISELDSEWENMRILSKDMIESAESYELEKQLNTRKKGIKKLKDNKDSVKRAMIDLLVDKTNDSLAPDIEREVNSFIDGLAQDLRSDPTDDDLPRSSEDILGILGTHLPGRTEEVREERAEHVLQAYNFLRTEEKAKGENIRNYLLEVSSNSLSPDEIDRSWTNYLRDNLSRLPRIQEPGGGTRGLWRYVSPELEQKVLVTEVDDWIKNLDEDPVGSGKAVEMQQAMIQHTYNYIQERGTATKEEIVESLPNYTAHYTNFDGLWMYCIRDALNSCDEIESGNRKWRYIGDEELPPELDLEIENWVENADISGGKMTKRERKAILQYAYNYLQEVEEAQRGDFREYFEANIPERTGRYSKFNNLWAYLLSEELESAPGVQTHTTGDVNPITYSYSD
ncbi:type I restriction enzyme HsdR N-terminal domain-containing protein [Natronococcus roseus]|uniref:type I restriction enzyme HsdR N-terminal domain-containing protein n=1 Tax=Natronococcus roseus TaxID=1052014 RepID=UPI00374D25E8